MLLPSSSLLVLSMLHLQTALAYWMENVPHGQMPLVSTPNYKFFRNIRDYGAKGDGVHDDTVAINAAITDGNRCGKDCGSTSIAGALVYFPTGTYLISAPLIQYYYTQFVGDPTNRPSIKGSKNFQGIALIDVDPYIPGGNGAEWYINQNQFYRQIRNINLDLTAMPELQIDPVTYFATFNATGIHWQVAQATSLQFIDIRMPTTPTTNATGIFMENGSGGFVSDLTFEGGGIGFRAGSQQFTARNLQFDGCRTAISMVWDWGFTWKSLGVKNANIGIDCTSYGGPFHQGTGSISVLDSSFTNVKTVIPVSDTGVGPQPAIILDNVDLQNVGSVVASGSRTILAGKNGNIRSWGMGRTYTAANNAGTKVTGDLTPPSKSANLLDSHGHFLELSRPVYRDADAPTMIATRSGILNDGTGDQSSAINKFLRSSIGQTAFFPAGIYQVQNTVFIPPGVRIVGEGWSQIMGFGPKFGDAFNPRPVVRVGLPGDRGSVQLSDLLFTVKGSNPGAILMEWNIHEDQQGSAAMWDCHFRVGGAKGSDLQVANCNKHSLPSKQCQGAAMLFHMTPTSSGYFENVWGWVADHDLDAPASMNPNDTQINIYSGRGFLIESQGPSWFYGTASEHNQLYQYNLVNAKNIFMGHMQTETPYYQPTPQATQPFSIGRFTGDPTFSDCKSTDKFCQEAWALRVIRSSNIYIYSAGFYSFFQSYTQACVDTETCQNRLVQTSFSQGLWLYNLFTKGSKEAISPTGGITAATQKDNQAGFTTEIAAWLTLSTSGGDKGDDGASSGKVPRKICRPPRASDSGSGGGNKSKEKVVGEDKKMDGGGGGGGGGGKKGQVVFKKDEL